MTERVDRARAARAREVREQSICGVRKGAEDARGKETGEEGDGREETTDRTTGDSNSHRYVYRYNAMTEGPNYDFFGPSSFFPISAPRSLTPKILSNLLRT